MNHALQHADRYCVIQSDDRWFGINALAVRGIVPRPELTPTPQSDPSLQGICHIQNEFLPVVSMRALTKIQYDTTPDTEQQLLILLGPQGPWGLLIDKAESLVELETSISALSSHDDKWAKVTFGSASWRNEVLEILDPAALFAYALNLVDGFWANANLSEETLAGI